MANIVKSNEPQPSTFEPLRALRDWLGFDPFRVIGPSPTRLDREWNPSFEVRETPESYLFRADLPGVKLEDVEVALTGNRLQISGKREAEHETKDETVYLWERSFGSFVRAFTLPDGVDAEHARSQLEHGVLTVIIPKLPATKAKKITVQGAGPKS